MLTGKSTDPFVCVQVFPYRVSHHYVCQAISVPRKGTAVGVVNGIPIVGRPWFIVYYLIHSLCSFLLLELFAGQPYYPFPAFDWIVLHALKKRRILAFIFAICE